MRFDRKCAVNKRKIWKILIASSASNTYECMEPFIYLFFSVCLYSLTLFFLQMTTNLSTHFSVVHRFSPLNANMKCLLFGQIYRMKKIKQFILNTYPTNGFGSVKMKHSILKMRWMTQSKITIIVDFFSLKLFFDFSAWLFSCFFSFDAHCLFTLESARHMEDLFLYWPKVQILNETL